MLGLSAFIILFSLLNLLNTLITNMVTRKQEFAMLQSIGMSEKQLYQMVQSEGILLAGGNVLLTLVGGTLGGIGMIEVMRYFEAEYMHYHFPLWYFLVYTVLLVVIPIIVSRVVFYFFKKEALVERIRNSD
ncbi:MAG: ABC transporter permease, partial [Faecalimonas sp.]|nr:ABC transporter permease [Faecalimonas sp.]